MTAPVLPTVSTPAMAAIAEARCRDRLYNRHFELCRNGCRTGGLCERGQQLLHDADSADARVRLAEWRARGRGR